MANTTNNSSGLRGPRGIPGAKGLDGDAGANASNGQVLFSLGEVTTSPMSSPDEKSVSVTKNGSAINFDFKVLPYVAPPVTVQQLLSQYDPDYLPTSTWSPQYPILNIATYHDEAGNFPSYTSAGWVNVVGYFGATGPITSTILSEIEEQYRTGLNSTGATHTVSDNPRTISVTGTNYHVILTPTDVRIESANNSIHHFLIDSNGNQVNWQ